MDFVFIGELEGGRKKLLCDDYCGDKGVDCGVVRALIPKKLGG